MSLNQQEAEFAETVREADQDFQGLFATES
jgi:hypothetical protein